MGEADIEEESAGRNATMTTMTTKASSEAWMSWESPAWTRGSWINAPAGDPFPPPYTPQQCGDIRFQFLTEGSPEARWRPSSDARVPLSFPRADELHARVRGR